jgi:DNA-binding MarR family transcriptional regulator
MAYPPWRILHRTLTAGSAQNQSRLNALPRGTTPGMVRANPIRARLPFRRNRKGNCEHVAARPRDFLIPISPEYVNMADLIGTLVPSGPSVPGNREVQQDEPIWDIIELLFFAYRDFVGEPDGVLAKFGFGRAHHRVLHFVNRNPGMKVAELLDILKITKQSLARVLKQLVDEGYIAQKEGANDRRQRLLYVTPKGEALAMKLASLQTQRVRTALSELGAGAHDMAHRFLTGMVNSENREKALRFIARADRARRQRS